MSSVRTKEIILICNQSATKMQSISDFLLLANNLQPVSGNGNSNCDSSYSKCKESVVSRTKGLLVHTGRLSRLIVSTSNEIEDIGESVQDVCELTVGFIECCTHMAYLVAANLPHCTPAHEGAVNAYTFHKTCLNIELCCDRFKLSDYCRMTPGYLLNLCTEINNNLGLLAECCKSASSNTLDQCNKEQFKLCIKSFTSCGSSLVNAIKSFKKSPSEKLHQRCVYFCEPLLSSIKATKHFATEEQFLGTPSTLSQHGSNAKMEILGACLSITSANIHMCHCVRDLVHNRSCPIYIDNMWQCIAAISKASRFLGQVLSKYSTQDTCSPALEHFPEEGAEDSKSLSTQLHVSL